MNYSDKKKILIEAVRSSKGKVALQKKTSNLFRQRSQGDVKKIDVRDFNEIISIDAKKKTITVEGMTPYERIVPETLKYGLIPAFVPELKTITVGGEIAGIGIESSGFRHGFAHETVKEFELLTGDGKVITCSPTKNKDLFYGFPNTYGTLGYILKAEIMLIPCKKYVKLTHNKYSDLKKFLKDMKETAVKNRKGSQIAYVESCVFSDKEFVLTISEFTDEPEWVSDYTWMNMYYKSIQEKDVDYLKTEDYLFRFDTDWFWNTSLFGLQFKIVRFLLGRRLMQSKNYYALMRFSEKLGLKKLWKRFFYQKSEHLIQDYELPYEKAEEFIRWKMKEVGIFPFVVVPVIRYGADFTMFPLKKDQVYMNVGFYGKTYSDKEPLYYDKLLEKKANSMGVRKMLYSSSYYTKEQFWKLFRKSTYYGLKKKYDPNSTFRDLYDKCVLRK